MFLVLPLAVGCPSTNPSAVVISNVIVVGDPTTTSFELEVEGRGFGLSEVVYDVPSGTGTSSASAMFARIVDAGGGNALVVARGQLQLLSPRLIKIQVRLDTPLRAGDYGVELHDSDDLLADKTPAFRVEGDAPPVDAGVDGGVNPDTGVPLDAGVDAGEPDTGVEIDAGPPDSGVPPDSGLGPFVGGYRYRRQVSVLDTEDAPGGATIVVPIPHAQLLAETKAKADATDIVVYQGADPLPFQWSDPYAVGTDGLEMVVELARAIPVGGDPADPLVLYYGDPLNGNNVPTDAVFKFVVHFNDGIGPFGQGNANAWYSPEDWDYCRWDRPQESTDVGYDGAVCVQDDDGGASQRRSLATPKTTLLMTPGANLTYEMSIWLAGSNPDGATDMFYFSYGPDNYRYQLTQVLPTTAWTGYVPTASLTFTEIDNSTRTVVGGWQLPPTQTWWQRAVATFTPTIDLPSLHLRNVSNNNGSNNYIGVDDWWVRLAVDAPTINLGPEETR